MEGPRTINPLPLLLLMVGCGQPFQQDSGPPVGGDDSVPVEDGPPQPTLNAQEVADAVSALLLQLDTSPRRMMQTYLEALRAGDESCPGPTEQLGDTVPVEGCTASTDWWYLGVSSYTTLTADTEGGHEETALLWGDLEIHDPQGHSFAIGGFCSTHLVTRDEAQELHSNFSGTFLWEGSDRPGYALGFSGDLSSLVREDKGVQQLELTGQVSVGNSAMSLEPLIFSEGCTGPVGLVRYRGEDGRWYVLGLDQSCSGCGQVQFGAEMLGDACLSGDWAEAVKLEFGP